MREGLHPTKRLVPERKTRIHRAETIHFMTEATTGPEGYHDGWSHAPGWEGCMQGARAMRQSCAPEPKRDGRHSLRHRPPGTQHNAAGELSLFVVRALATYVLARRIAAAHVNYPSPAPGHSRQRRLPPAVWSLAVWLWTPGAANSGVPPDSDVCSTSRGGSRDQ